MFRQGRSLHKKILKMTRFAVDMPDLVYILVVASPFGEHAGGTPLARRVPFAKRSASIVGLVAVCYRPAAGCVQRLSWVATRPVLTPTEGDDQKDRLA